MFRTIYILCDNCFTNGCTNWLLCVQVNRIEFLQQLLFWIYSFLEIEVIITHENIYENILIITITILFFLFIDFKTETKISLMCNHLNSEIDTTSVT